MCLKVLCVHVFLEVRKEQKHIYENSKTPSSICTLNPRWHLLPWNIPCFQKLPNPQ